jgi:cellulose biosynthesis protein BcsQ
MMIEAAECIPVKKNKKLFLLPGSFDLSEYEVSLGVSFTLSSSLTSLKNLPGSFNFLIEKTAKKYDIDYVIIDMNPSLSAINQILLLSSDYFIVPATPDYFSIMAIKSLSKILPKWEKWAVSARQAFKDSIYPFPATTPKFLGTVIQGFNIRNGKATAANRTVIEKLNKTVSESFVQSLETEGMVLEKSKYKNMTYCLSEISSFNTLNAIYQTLGIPVFQLTDKQLGRAGSVLISYQNTRKKFYENFSNLTDSIITMSDE